MINALLGLLAGILGSVADIGLEVVSVLIGLFVGGKILQFEQKLFRAIPWRYVGVAAALALAFLVVRP